MQAHPATIKPFHPPEVALIYPLPSNPSFTPYSSYSSFRFFIYLCYLALPLAFSFLTFDPTMVKTRAKNKNAHPATPVMTEAAKKKAGIKTKARKKRATKDETIRELTARLAAAENPDGEPFSKEPLVRSVCITRAQALTVRPIVYEG
jgi:hypothetical protein